VTKKAKAKRYVLNINEKQLASKAKAKRYVLNINEKQLAFLCEAVELHARCCIGQLSDVAFKCYMGDMETDEFCEIRDDLERVGKKVQNSKSRASGLRKTRGCYTWDIYEVVRHELAKSHKPDCMCVWCDEPSQTSDEPLPSIKEVSE
jgi:hypothetical protein